MSLIFTRPLCTFCIALITGILTAYITGSVLFILGLLFLLLVALCILNAKFKGRLYICIGVLFFYALGAFEYLLLDNANKGRFAEFAEKTVSVRGYVDSEPDIKDSRISYIIRVVELTTGDGGNTGSAGKAEKASKTESASKTENASKTDSAEKAVGGGKIKGGRLMLGMIREEDTKLFEYGSELTFTGRLTLPKGVRNPGGFDYRRYLAQNGVCASVFVSAGSVRKGEGNEGSFLIKAGRTIKYMIVDVIDKSLPRQQAGLLNGMLIGCREGLSQEVTDAFCDAGLTHIMAVSGANIVFLIIPLAFIFKRLRLGPKLSGILIMAFLAVFIFITGFEPSVLRAVIMAFVILTAGMVYRETDVYTSMAFSVMLLLVISPYMLFNVGFQLSYAATLSIVLFYRNIKEFITFRFIPPSVAGVLAATVSAQLGVLPITLAYFNRVSLVSVLSNLLAVPLLEVITILGMFMAVLGQISVIFSQLLGYINYLPLTVILYITKISSSLPFAVVRTVTPSIPVIILYYVGLWFFLWYRPLKNIKIKPVYVSTVLTTCVLMLSASLLLPGKLEVVFLDVGEGDSTFIRTYSGRNILLDGGGSTDPNTFSKIGKSVVAPFLLDRSVTTLDAVIASHGHSDHIQGLQTVLEQFRVRRLIIPVVEDEKEFSRLLVLASAKKIPVVRCSKGDLIKLDGRTSFDVLSPSQKSGTSGPSEDNASLNNTSLVLKLHYGSAEVLFTGDAQTETELELVDSGADLGAEVVKIAHHGSQTSSGSRFLDKIGPAAAIVSVGKNNFGHPSPVTMGRLADKGIQVFRTDECGAVILTSRGKDIRISGFVKH